MNVYKVTISEYCRKQPRKLFDFVIQCVSDQNQVYHHYSKQYSGLSINVEPCNVLTLECDTEKSPTVNSGIKTETIKTLCVDVNLNAEEKAALTSILQSKNRLSTAISELRSTITKRLRGKFSEICYESSPDVSVIIKGDYPQYINDYSITAKFHLNGSLTKLISENINNEEK